MTSCHLVILKRPYLDAILQGRKKIESRFTKTKGHGFEQVCPGDKLFPKVSSGPVCATATAADVKNFGNLTTEQMLELKQLYNKYIVGDEKYWQSKINCRFGFLVWLKDVKPIEPVWINKKDWRAWVVLSEKENFGLLKINTNVGVRKENS